MSNVKCAFCQKSREKTGPQIATGDGSFSICGSCIDLAKASLSKHSPKGDESPETPIPAEIKAFLDEYVIGQGPAKKALAVAVFDHFIRINNPPAPGEIELEKSNVLMLGPTGCGKTLIARTIARMLKVPFTIADANRLTQAGYVGDDVEDILTPLVAECGGDPKKIERSIVFIDEIDKLAAGIASENVRIDVGGRGVQQALLKLLEGSKIRVPLPGKRRMVSSSGEVATDVEIDTSNILFIVGGAFPTLHKIIGKRVNKRSSVGFGSASTVADKLTVESDLLSQVQTEDLKKFGLIPEFLGRIPAVVTLRELDEDQLVKVLTEPRNALLRQKVREFQLSCGTELVFTEGAVRAIAAKAINEGRGARGLRTIVDPLLQDLKFELPSRRGEVASVTITQEVVEGTSEPLLEVTAAQANG